jgi:outer membrane murein-binding lipoprotein Lpp
MRKAAEHWTDARLDDLAAALAPLPAQVAVLTATVDRLSEETRALRDELATTQRQLLQIAWGLVTALLGVAAALAAALL